MAKILIIDSNDERRKSLTAKLRGLGQVVSVMSMINQDNLRSIITSNEVLIFLDQENDLAKKILLSAANQEMKCILNNESLENEVEATPDIIFLHDQAQELEQSIVHIIDSIYSANPRVQPIANDPRSVAAFEIARKAAKTNATVLVTGETGTGKEVMAQYIHQCSSVSHGPFISVNCAALPDNMMEAILFGYEKGSFTSAVSSYIGKFEQAHNGTLLLDEISEISIGLQAKLLRVLQERELERLGGKKVIKINVRIIAATNRNLQQQVIDGLFRKDLYYRLNVLPIHCPALRERPMDILPIAEFFMNKYAKQFDRTVSGLSDKAQRKLANYHWQGNIREMDNVIQRAIIMTENDIITENDINISENLFDLNTADNDQFHSRFEASEAKVIIDALKETDGRRNIAAKNLNISPRTLRYKIAKLRAIGLKVP